MTLRSAAVVALALFAFYRWRAGVQLTDSFTLGEFMRVSSVPILTPFQESMAQYHAELLQPVRDALVQRHGDAGKVRVTSFVRGSGSHRYGAVDVQTVGGGNELIRELADMLAARYVRADGRGQYAQVIFEMPEPGQTRAHVHLAPVLVPGAAPGYLLDLAGNRSYTAAPIPAVV